MNERERLEQARRQRQRLDEIVGRFVRPEDSRLTDKELVQAAYERWLKHASEPVLDPAE
jgi:hypothetical protein